MGTISITRKQAAQIIHNFLRMELREADEIDGSPAYALRDLFDCCVCAGHIIQVYVKGIMDAVTLSEGRLIFDAESYVTEAEFLNILTKACYPEFRTPRVRVSNGNSRVNVPEEISLEQAMQLLKENGNILLADVRTEREYEKGHLEGARNVPLMSVIKNPFCFNETPDKTIVLYCNEGYQSKAAAQCLLEAGYEKVAFFAKK